MTAAPLHQATIPPVDLACVLDVLHDVTTLLCAIRQECKRLTNDQIPIERRDPTLALVISNEAIGRFKSLFDVVHATTETQADLLEYMPVIDLADIVQTAVKQARHLIEIYARAMEPCNVPVLSFKSMRSAMPVRAFQQVIGRIIQNLIINSFQAGASVIQITLTIVLGEAVLVVHDDGPGFPPLVIEQVTPGYTTKLDGHGLGLVAVIANVQRLAGTIELENRTGARVTIKLPLVLGS
jgi:signal transduction histidine kinase